MLPRHRAEPPQEHWCHPIAAPIDPAKEVLGHGPVAQAHDSRPAYLEINETAPGRYEMLWRTPVSAGMHLPVTLKLPDDIRNITAPSLIEFTGLLLERRWINTGKTGLAGKRIEFVGMQATITDVLIRVQALDGTHTTTLVRPSQPWVEIAPSQGIAGVAAAYLVHGFEHIMFGTDHLLFVLGLMLMVHDLWALLKTITAFTVAHSITLAAATLGYVHVPGPPLEAVNCAFNHVRRGRGLALLAWRDEPHAAPALGCRVQPSGSCMDWDSPAGLPASACRNGIFPLLCCSLTSASRRANCRS